MTQSSQQRPRGLFDTIVGQGPHGRQETFEDRPGWPQPQRQFSPSARSTNLPGYSQQPQPAARENSFEHDGSNATLVHQQERGVSQLQNAVSAATTGNAGRPTSMMQISPGLGQPASLAQSGAMTGLPGQQGDMKRGPVEFNHAISYVNKIKVSGLQYGRGGGLRGPRNKVNALTWRNSLRTDSHSNLTSISNSLKFCRHINESRSQFKTFTPR
jgi:hypothetical protein